LNNRALCRDVRVVGIPSSPLVMETPRKAESE
jgi:hypothetical protein